MALPHILKHVYTNGTDEVIRRGKKTHALGFVELVEFDKLTGNIVFRVKDDTYSSFYKVYIQKYSDPKQISLRCTCPYNLGDICKHEVASCFSYRNCWTKDNWAMRKYTTISDIPLLNCAISTFALCGRFAAARASMTQKNFFRKKKAKIISAKDETVKANVALPDKDYTVVIRKNDERNFDTSCEYEDTEFPLCLPKVIVFMQLIRQHGADYFDTIRNRDVEKNKLLEAYGYSLADDLKGKFEFVFKDGKPFLRVLDSKIKG